MTQARREILVGTKEAAALTGVRPPNFVRDWASRADFPAPVATLSSGRVWRRRDIEAYLRRQPSRARAPHRGRVSRARLLQIAARVVWWQPPDQTLADRVRFLAGVMTIGTLREITDVRRAFGDAALRRVLADPPGGVFDPRSWTFWHIVLQGPDAVVPALPVRRLPG